MRFRVSPRDVPAQAAARRLGTSVADFMAILPKLLARGFPRPDPDTGNFDLSAIERWCDERHPHLFGSISAHEAFHAANIAHDRITLMKSSFSRG
jgi:hypothetical protein